MLAGFGLCPRYLDLSFVQVRFVLSRLLADARDGVDEIRQGLQATWRPDPLLRSFQTCAKEGEFRFETLM